MCAVLGSGAAFPLAPPPCPRTVPLGSVSADGSRRCCVFHALAFRAGMPPADGGLGATLVPLGVTVMEALSLQLKVIPVVALCSGALHSHRATGLSGNLVETVDPLIKTVCFLKIDFEMLLLHA